MKEKRTEKEIRLEGEIGELSKTDALIVRMECLDKFYNEAKQAIEEGRNAVLFASFEEPDEDEGTSFQKAILFEGSNMELAVTLAEFVETANYQFSELLTGFGSMVYEKAKEEASKRFEANDAFEGILQFLGMISDLSDDKPDMFKTFPDDALKDLSERLTKTAEVYATDEDAANYPEEVKQNFKKLIALRKPVLAEIERRKNSSSNNKK